MKTIVISDITEDTRSIIPYALKIGKYTQTRVEILHFIDPILQQGNYSNLSDSQTFTPAEKLPHEQLLNREKYWAEMEIHKLLSREASMLNYPLRIQEHIAIRETANALREFISEDNPVIITSTTPSKAMLSGLNELLMIAGEFDVMVLVVPGNHPFTAPREGILVTDFSPEQYQHCNQIFRFLQPFNPLIYACDISYKQHDEPQLKIDKWMELVKRFDHSECIVKTGVMHGHTESRSLQDYVEMYTPEIVIMPIHKRERFTPQTGNTPAIVNLVESLNTPVLFY